MSVDIKRILQDTKLFTHLSDNELDKLSRQVVHKEYKANDIILKEGDIGDLLYIILSGAVRVYTYKEGKEIVLARLEGGNYFGEQALLTEKPVRRNANVRALSDIETITISHKKFQKCLKENQLLLTLLQECGKEQLMTKLIAQLQTQEHDQKELSLLFQRIETFTEGEVFFRQGDKPDYAYYLLSGTVEIRFYDNDRRVKSRTVINPGQFFGELGILENTPRAGMAVVLTEARAAIIEESMLRELYQRHFKLGTFIDAQLQLYHIPVVGMVTQYQSNFYGQPAINTAIQKQNKEMIIASKIVDADIFTIYHTGSKAAKTESFKTSDAHTREIMLSEDNNLLGVISIGKWEDLETIAKLVYEKSRITPENLIEFFHSGQLGVNLPSVTGEGNLCECLQVKYQTIKELISKGITSLKDISKLTAAGTVCGGCKPRIIELLGGNAWTYVKIIGIKKHTDLIQSYQLQSLDKVVFPYKTGQHIVIEANIDGLWIARSYTLTSVDDNKEYYEITVKREQQGLFSRWLYDNCKKLTPSQLRITAPQGNFIFQTDKNIPAICFMAGIGITPAIAFARKLIASQHKRVLHIDYSISQDDQMAFRDVLSDWPGHFSNIRTTIRITSKQGHIKEIDIYDLINQYPDAEFFICGPTAYENAVTSILNKIGIEKDKIILERFTNAGGPIEIVH